MVSLGPLAVSRLGLASSYGARAREVDLAFERGVNFFFWGAMRKASFGAGVKRLAARKPIVIAIQSFAKKPWMLRPSVEIARRRLGIDRVDVLCLAFRSEGVDAPMLDAARALVDRDLVRSLMVSCHDRPMMVTLAASFETLMVRYNAAHRGAEKEVFPAAQARRRDVLAYTATRWGNLLDPRLVPSGERVPSAADCYRFVLDHPAVSACLCGPANSAELLEGLAALDRGPLSEDERAWMIRAGAGVRGHLRTAPPLGLRDYALGVVQSIRERGLTEDLVSRFNR